MIESGCIAIVSNSFVIENIGKIVTVGSFFGDVHRYVGNDRWEVSVPMADDKGGQVRHQRETNLTRIDNSIESDADTVNEEMAME